MTTSLKYFMVVAEEESVAKAAKKLYLSQQNLSNHIHRLEEEYGVLFIRKPQFQLTPTGKILLRTIQQISLLEKNMEQQIKNLRTDEFNYLRIGIHATRARMLLPRVIPEYRRKFPNVFLDFRYADMNDNEKMLSKGEIDLMFGVDVHRRSDFHYIFLQKEPIFLVASENLIQRYGIRLETGVVPVEKISGLPCLLSPVTSKFRKKIDLFCAGAGVTLHEIASISDFELQMMLAAKDQGVCFCPQMLLGKLEELNRTGREGGKLTAMRVELLNFTSELSLVTHRMTQPTKVLEGLIQVFREQFPQNEVTGPSGGQ